jgi:hypothetical protein
MSSPLPSYGTPTVYDDSPVATPPDDPDTFNMPEFNPDEGLPNAPGEQDASLGGALGAMAGMGFGDVGVGDVGMGGGGLGAVGGTEGVGGAGDTSGGSVG